MQLFYNPEISKDDKQVIFQKDESRHIVKVLRKNEGDLVNITNGKGLLFKAEIIRADIKQCLAKVIEVENQPPPPYYLHMIVAPTKMNDRFEWFLEKAMEIGVHEITPVICEHSERKVVKLNRFERVLQSAMKQSLHYRMPQLNEPVNFSEFSEKGFEGLKFIAHCEDGMEKYYLQHKLEPKKQVNILIGPEGDFSSKEISTALKNDWIPVSLGDSRLRTETAAIVACHTVALVNQES
ncbi:16S rRNA (uracil(1498)-N(3))-methyltransferase [Christiangramia salexigens]|uniref:Ribosomal RNA small subunit methyltransferase E n=1 Tax=Christiangramia salexigens TaxID=1913577 RepID=A0A1L3J320_9FLAO|nr:16S rRNA (uracil(1498)-N(3))-methyltransferase [Christiangramia salexigens]APG59521.1 16S rRNA (uracil(1498)-N(3))-methyltransferase [Christiangramia salexigens]